MYTIDETGVMNSYATEPKMYFAPYPSVEQQRRYMLQGALAILLVTATLAVSLTVS
ncbi:MAG: ssl1498 family light-harvesting-like protein [Thermosynechococcaceae cyanobacterium]